MELRVKEFKKQLIDDDKTMKAWAKENRFDLDRLKNLIYGYVKPKESEVAKINNYADSEG